MSKVLKCSTKWRYDSARGRSAKGKDGPLTMNLILNLSLCGVLIVAAIAVGLYRRWLENHCDSYIHLHNDAHDASIVTTQAAMCKRLETMTKLTRALVVAVILYLLAIGAFAIYNAWNNPGA